jgi:DNA-binding IclR family transcriptional regulator
MSKRDARIDALLTFLASNPGAGPTEAGRAIGVSRQTVYTYANELEAAGRLRKNGSGWEAVS